MVWAATYQATKPSSGPICLWNLKLRDVAAKSTFNPQLINPPAGIPKWPRIFGKVFVIAGGWASSRTGLSHVEGPSDLLSVRVHILCRSFEPASRSSVGESRMTHDNLEASVRSLLCPKLLGVPKNFNFVNFASGWKLGHIWH